MVRERPFNSIEGRTCPRAKTPKGGLKNVLFICTHNSARSQMAEGFLNRMYGDVYRAYSAGIRPGRIDPRAVDVMAEAGVDISCQRSKSLEDVLDLFFDTVVTVCDDAKESCPIYPGGAELIHHGFEDPSKVDGSPEERMSRYRELRDEIKKWIEEAFGPSSPRYLANPSLLM